MKATTKANFGNDVLKSDKTVLLDVWAPWCAPCRGMEPIIESISKEMANNVDVVKLDASAEMDQVQELGVTGLPTFITFKNGKPVGSIIGATSKDSLIKLISQA
jgi:thioredoxin 1